jgi:hypothetical protein
VVRDGATPLFPFGAIAEIPDCAVLLLTACVTAQRCPARALVARPRLAVPPGRRRPAADLGHGESYGNAKAGNAAGAAGTEYDDSDWRRLDLPHDWAVEGPFDPNANVGAGLSSARHRLVPVTCGGCGRSRQAF